MMDITDFVEHKSDFLNASIVKEHPSSLWGIKDEAKREMNNFGKEILRVTLVRDGNEEYSFEINKTNARAISEKLGNDTTAWIGCALKLGTYKTRVPEKKELMDAIAVEQVFRSSEL